MTGDTNDAAKPAEAPATRYVWECLDDECGRREISDCQADLKSCECGSAMMAIALADDDGSVVPARLDLLLRGAIQRGGELIRECAELRARAKEAERERDQLRKHAAQAIEDCHTVVVAMGLSSTATMKECVTRAKLAAHAKRLVDAARDALAVLHNEDGPPRWVYRDAAEKLGTAITNAIREAETTAWQAEGPDDEGAK